MEVLFFSENNQHNWTLIFFIESHGSIFCFQNRLRGSGHGIVAARMGAKLNVAGWISEQMGGIRLDNLIFSTDFLLG